MTTTKNCFFALVLGFSTTFLACDYEGLQVEETQTQGTPACRSWGCIEDPNRASGQYGCIQYVCLDDSSPLPTVTPTNLDFGTVALGTTVQLQVTVAGFSSQPHPVVAGEGFALNDGQFNSDYTQLVLNVTFTPTATGPSTGIVTITPGVTVSLSGIGANPDPSCETWQLVQTEGTFNGKEVCKDGVPVAPWTKLSGPCDCPDSTPTGYYSNVNGTWFCFCVIQ